MEANLQAPTNFFERSSGWGAAEAAARQNRIRRKAASFRIGKLLERD
jgi:hypothetical protein